MTSNICQAPCCHNRLHRAGATMMVCTPQKDSDSEEMSDSNGDSSGEQQGYNSLSRPSMSHSLGGNQSMQVGTFIHVSSLPTSHQPASDRDASLLSLILDIEARTSLTSSITSLLLISKPRKNQKQHYICHCAVPRCERVWHPFTACSHTSTGEQQSQGFKLVVGNS